MQWTEPPSGVAYPQVLRTKQFSPFHAIMGVLLALTLYLVCIPLIHKLLLDIFWVFRGRPDANWYFKTASAYELPEGLVAGQLALASLLLISILIYRYVHSMPSCWLFSVQPGLRWRYLLACTLMGVVVLNLVGWISLLQAKVSFGAGEPGWVWFLVAVLICTPFQAAAEEVFFRGYLLQGIGALSVNRWLPVGFTAFIFASFHGTQNLALFTERFVFGLLAGALVVLTGGLEAGIAAHILNNLLAFSYGLFTGGVAKLKATQQLSWVQAIWSIGGFAIFAGLAWLIGQRMRVATLTPRERLLRS